MTGCDKECIQAQIDAGHRGMGVNKSDGLRKSSQKEDVPLNKPKPKRVRSR